MKKTMIFNSREEYDVWFDTNEEKEGGFDFLENRVVIIKETRTIQGRKFNGFSADATIECKKAETAIRRFIKEVKSHGFDVDIDDFEGMTEGNFHCMAECGMVVEVEEIDDGIFYINYMCYQDEVEEEETEEITEETTETEEEITEETTENEEEILEELKADCIKKAVKSYKEGTTISIQGLYKKTRTGIKTVIVDSYKQFEYYINKGYDFYCCPTFADILKYTDSEFWEKFKNS